MEWLTAKGNSRACSTCDGHRSLKAAALYGYLHHFDGYDTPELPIRCEGCGHPMSEGIWNPTGDGTFEQSVWSLAATNAFKHNREPTYQDVVELRYAAFGLSTYFSRCDEGCRHGGPIRERTAGRPGAQGIAGIEASWRQVDVRTLGWAHDLRPESLAVLCLRCNANREEL